MKGGKREGVGRPPADNPAIHIVKARLNDQQYANWVNLGASRWVKRMIEQETDKLKLERELKKEMK